MTIEFKGGPLGGQTLTFMGDRPDASVLHVITHPPPLGPEFWRYALMSYDTDGTNARAIYGEPVKLPDQDGV